MTLNSFQLPYNFDTTRPGRIIFLGLLYSAALIALIAFFLPVMMPPDDDGTLYITQISLIPVVIADIVAAFYAYKKHGGVKGRLSRGLIQMEADLFLGVPSTAPTGTFSPHSFSGIQLRRIHNVGSRGSEHLRKVCLIGIPPLGNVTIATLPVEDAEKLASLLSAELPLRLET